MDETALEVLEFPAITARLARAAETAYGEERARALVPSGDAEEVARRQALTAEVTALFELSAEPPLQGIHDVRASAEHAARGGALSPQGLAEIGTTVVGAINARAALDEQAALAPLLTAIAAAIEPSLRPLADEIARRVEEDGSDLRDGASPQLRSCAASSATAGSASPTSSASSRARRGLREHLQEDFVTERGGRPVLAREGVARGAACPGSCTTRPAPGRRSSSSRSRSSS